MTVGPADHTDVVALPAVERAAGAMFALDDLPPEHRNDATPLDTLTVACTEGRLWVARDGRRRPVGFALGGTVDGRPHLAEIAVHPDHGRRGVGSQLLDAVGEWARRRGTMLTLTTFAHVAWNAPFYARRGFRVLGVDEAGPELQAILRAEVASGLQNRVAMGRRLE
jgi:GNAT superfamily N-acetyltransferase